jgi:menaquinone-9 beta-reductase
MMRRNGRLPDSVDVVVVGGGPGGSAAAHYLARAGRRVVLFDRHRFPRDKACGDGLTPRALQVLDEMGALSSIADAQTIRGVRLVVRGRGVDQFSYPADTDRPGYGLVVPRMILDHAILRRAVAAGAEVCEDALVTDLIRSSDGAVRGVRVRVDGRAVEVRAPVTVLASGSASRLARSLREADDGQGMGFAIRAYVSGITRLEDQLEIFMPVFDATDQYLLPSYGWVFPVDGGSANVGIGLFDRAHDTNLRRLAEWFFAELTREDDRFRKAHVDESWKAAPLQFDFTPARVAAPGVVLVGDAAGLVSPFTGEGISYALESGRTAADVIDRNLRYQQNGALDLSDYTVLMERDYLGYFEAGRKSARRNLLGWHVLVDTFDRQGPLFTLTRRAAVFPEGVGEVYASKILDDVSPLVAPGMRIREGLVAVGDILLDITRKEWPFLGRTWLGGHGDPHIPFRPALLVLLGAQFGDPDAPEAHRMAAALELGYLAGLAHLSVEEEPAPAFEDGVRANWGNRAAVVLGDFLLTKAYALTAAAGPEMTRLVAGSMYQATEGQLIDTLGAYDVAQTEARHLDTLARTSGPLFALPCEVGATLASAEADHVAALAEYGRNLGVAYRLADDALQILGREVTLGGAIDHDLRRGVYSLSLLKAIASGGEHSELRRLLDKRPLDDDAVARIFELVRESGAVDEVFAIARDYAGRARVALDGLPEGPARQTLARLAGFAVTREAGARPDLRSALPARPQRSATEAP